LQIHDGFVPQIAGPAGAQRPASPQIGSATGFNPRSSQKLKVGSAAKHASLGLAFARIGSVVSVTYQILAF